VFGLRKYEIKYTKQICTVHYFNIQAEVFWIVTLL